ncbi:Protein usf [Tetrabaena socialis]|uniref:Protein usf n=1 Tax=Tetrabaena socialis TaxID=47790 RepID=A0A2J7ZUM9_9CHLO|nr:Protein usf [Tetrabaena socialis]|eukprot:PNH03958.1 Protein usf [Tetrabaena socialis]
MALAVLALVAALLLGAPENAAALGRGLRQECKKNGDRCSLYAEGDCCSGMMCTMPLECSSRGSRSECFPECRKQTLSKLNKVDYPSSSGKTPALEAGQRSRPAVVVMQEWWGVNEAIKATALHIAEQGYRVLIPDLYRGRVALQVMEAIGLASDLNWTRGIDDVVHAVTYLRKTGAKRVAIIGFCQGGAMAFCGAQFAGVNAALPFYGIPNNISGCNPLRIPANVPIQAHFGTNDNSFPVSRIQPLALSMQQAGVNIKLNLYEGLPHAFFNALTPEGRRLLAGNNPNYKQPNETLVTQSFSRMTNFLRLHIRDNK